MSTNTLALDDFFTYCKKHINSHSHKRLLQKFHKTEEAFWAKAEGQYYINDVIDDLNWKAVCQLIADGLEKHEPENEKVFLERVMDTFAFEKDGYSISYMCAKYVAILSEEMAYDRIDEFFAGLNEKYDRADWIQALYIGFLKLEYEDDEALVFCKKLWVEIETGKYPKASDALLENMREVFEMYGETDLMDAIETYQLNKDQSFQNTLMKLMPPLRFAHHAIFNESDVFTDITSVLSKRGYSLEDCLRIISSCMVTQTLDEVDETGEFPGYNEVIQEVLNLNFEEMPDALLRELAEHEYPITSSIVHLMSFMESMVEVNEDEDLLVDFFEQQQHRFWQEIDIYQEAFEDDHFGGFMMYEEIAGCNFEEAVSFLIDRYLDAKREEQGIAFLDKLVNTFEFDDDDEMYLYLRTMIVLLMDAAGKHDDANLYLSKWQIEKPDSNQPTRALLALYHQRNQNEEAHKLALKILDNGIENVDESLSLLVSLGQVFHEVNDEEAYGKVRDLLESVDFDLDELMLDMNKQDFS